MARQEKEDASGSGEKKTIVIVEDEEVLLEPLQRKLEAAGFIVHTAQDGASGLKMIRKIKPDLVLLDMLLPIMNGFSVLEALQEEDLIPSTPVLIISNSGQQIELDRAMKLGARDYLIKVNFDPAEVLARVRQMLALGAQLPGARPAHPPPQAGIGSTSDVLIVEDDIFLSDLLERKFILQGYRVQKAFDADQARRMLEESPKPGAILLDVVLPGSDGFALLQYVKGQDDLKKIPVLIISNLGQKEEIDKGMRLGADDYVVKSNSSPAQIVQKTHALMKK